MRCSSATFKNVLACPQGDSETHIVCKKRKIRLRIIRFVLEGGREELLITNLFDQSIGIEEFQGLYFLRWKVELKYREIQKQLKAENFAGKKGDNVLQKVYAAFAFSNIAAALKFLADEGIKRDPRGKGNKFERQTNRNFLIGKIKKALHQFLGGAGSAAKELKPVH